MTDSMGPGKLVRHMQNPSYTYDGYLICIGLGPSILSVICKNLSYSGPSYPSSPVLYFLYSFPHRRCSSSSLSFPVYICVLFLNVLGCLAYFIADKGNSSAGSSFGLSILYFLLFTPCSFICWYRPLYKAFR